MRNYIVLLLPFFFLSCQSEPVNYNNIAIQLNQKMENAFKAGEMKKLAAIYSDDGYLLSPNRKATQGRAAIDAYWDRWHSPIDWKLDVIAASEKEEDLYLTSYWQNMPEKPKHWEEEDIDLGDAKVFYQLGHSKIEYDSDDDVHRTSDVDFVIVWRKEADGVWRIFIDTYI